MKPKKLYLKMKINGNDSNQGRIMSLNGLYAIILFKLKAKRR